MPKQNQTIIAGRVIKIEPPQEFGSKGFRKSTAIIETGGDYPQQIPVEFLSKKADMVYDLTEGESVAIECNIYGREYNGRYYVSLAGWRVLNGREGDSKPEPRKAAQPPSEPIDSKPLPHYVPGDESLDEHLPF